MKKIITSCLFIVGLNVSQAQICTVGISHIINGNSVQYFGSSPDNPSAWSWFFNGGTPLTSSMQNQTVTYAMPGTYICALTVSGGPNNCSSSLSSAIDSVTITSTGIENQLSKTDAIEIVYLGSRKFQIINSVAQNVTIELLDMTGRKAAVVFRGRLESGINKLGFYTPDLNSGYYLLQVIGDNTTRSGKFYMQNQ
ncbi:MAG: T9SS type A sorting domain-containing protein [Bacteroidetes bacterium]|nr:T9SS type A sorting domain-containing protein [Bacteroidota bacterium]